MSKIDLWSTMRAWEELEIDANLVIAKDMKSRMRRESHVRFRAEWVHDTHLSMLLKFKGLLF